MREIKKNYPVPDERPTMYTDDINNECDKKLGTKNSSKEVGGMPKKNRRLSKKNQETESAESVQSITCQDYVYIKTSALPYIEYEDDWDLGVSGEVCLAKTIGNDENNANCENRMTTSKIGKLKHVREMVKEWIERKKKQIDLEKIKQDYLSVTSRTKPSMEMNLDDYHRWLSKDKNMLKESKTLAVLKANRQGTLKLVANAQEVLMVILRELSFKSKVLQLKSSNPAINRICLTITSKPNWAFFGKGYSKTEALEDASQYAIQFLLLMCV